MSRPLQVISDSSLFVYRDEAQHRLRLRLRLTQRHLLRSLALQARSAYSAARPTVCCDRELPTRQPAHRRLDSLPPTSLLASRHERACVGCAGHAGRRTAAHATRVEASALAMAMAMAWTKCRTRHQSRKRRSNRPCAASPTTSAPARCTLHRTRHLCPLVSSWHAYLHDCSLIPSVLNVTYLISLRKLCISLTSSHLIVLLAPLTCMLL